MNTFAKHTREDKSLSVANRGFQKQSDKEYAFQFRDNRFETIKQRKLQDVANTDSKPIQLKDFREMSNDYSSHYQQPLVRTKVTMSRIQPYIEAFPKDTIQRALARVRAAEGNESLIGTVELSSDRFPTNVPGGQGDHTVSAALFNLAVINHLEGVSFNEAGSRLIRLLAEIPEETSALYRYDGIGYENITVGSVLNEIGNYINLINDGVGLHKIISSLEECIEHIIRLWNKRQNAAHARTDDVTTGGGNESLSIDLLKFWRERDGDDKVYNESDMEAIATVINGLIDYSGNNNQENIDHVVEAVNLAVLALPAITDYRKEITDFIIRIRE